MPILSRPFALLLFAAAALAAHGAPPSGFTADPSSREQTRILYNTIYQASGGIPSGWTGDVPGGVAGTTSPDFKDAVVLRIDYFRAMAGVPATITFSDDFNAKCQQAALMMSANRATDHYPPTGWIDYTADGADAAAHANLALGTQLDGPPAIDAYVAETGLNNPDVGHRRWLLYPPETLMGTGDVDGTPDSVVLGSNVLWILDTASFADPSPAARDGFVAWPPPGFVPYPLISPRWSFSYPGADFSTATVSMTLAGVALPVRLEALTPGAGDNTLVWVPGNADANNPPPPAAPASETATSITVANVIVGGAARSFTYAVTPFDPAQPGADTVYPVLGGPAQLAAGATGMYTFNAVPGATGYRWRASGMTPLTLDLDAENGPGDVTVTPAAAPLVTTSRAASGLACYQLNSYPPETLAPDAAFVPTAGCTLSFSSQLAYATADETARVQISTDDGVTWTDLYTITGDGGVTEPDFAVHAIDLSGYAGRTCRVRFQDAFGGAGQYFMRGDDVGWFVDDIRVTGAQTAAAAGARDVADGQLQFAFQPAAAGVYALQAEPVFYGQYAANAGPLLTVTAVDPAAGGGGGPVVTVAATIPQAHALTAVNGVFTLMRAGGDLTQKLKVRYTLKGSAVDGTDYAPLPGVVKIKPGRTSAVVNVVPQGAAASGKVKLVVQPGDGYSVGAAAGAGVKIKP